MSCNGKITGKSLKVKMRCFDGYHFTVFRKLYFRKICKKAFKSLVSFVILNVLYKKAKCCKTADYTFTWSMTMQFLAPIIR